MKLLELLCLMIVGCSVRADNESNTTAALPTSVDQTSSPVTEFSTAQSTENSTLSSSTDVDNSTTETLSSSTPTDAAVVNITSSSTTADPAVVDITASDTLTSTVPVPSSTTIDPIIVKKNLVDKLSSQIGNILKHFQNPEPVGFPGQTVLDDPLVVPNTTTNLGAFVTGDFYNITIHGMSNFTVEAVNTVLDQMEVYMMIKMKKVVILGNCTLESIIGIRSTGPFNITLTNVTAEGTVFLIVEPDGRLVANRSISYMTYETLSVATTSEGILRTALTGASAVFLENLKPYILSQIDERITREVNLLLKNTPNIPSIVEMSPIDLAIVEGRKYVTQYYEPFVIEKIFDHDSEFLAVKVGPIQISGLSKFARVGAVTTKMANSTVQIGLRIITGRLFGHCHFFYDFGKVKADRNGTADFTVEHLQFEAKINQSVDLRKKPILDDLQLETGKIIVRFDGAGKLDYLVELGMQFLPQMLRYVILDALEEPIKQKIQTEVLDKLDLDQFILERLPLLELLLLSAL